MTVDYDDLRAKALAATPGPWRAVCRDVGNPDNALPWDHDRFLQWELEGPPEPPGRGQLYGEDAHYIAAANPATVLSLLDEIAAQYRAGFTAGFEAAREAAAKVCDELDKGFGGMPIYEIAERIRAIPLPGGEK